MAKALLDETKADRNAFDEVYVGQVLQAGCGQNPARQVALGAGIHDSISCCTINKVCGSGLQAVMFADQVIRAGDADLILAGGIESMSQAPFLSRTMRGGNKFGHGEMVDEMLYDGLTNVYSGELMGDVAEYTAEKGGAHARDAGRVVSEEPAARRRRRRSGQVQGRDRADRAAARQGHVFGRRDVPPRHEAGGPGEAQAGVQEGRHGHRGQRLAAL